MILHENRLPADDSHEISCLIGYFSKKRQNLKLPSAANYRWRFKGIKIKTGIGIGHMDPLADNTAKLCQGAGLSPHIKKWSGGGNHRLPKAQEGKEHERAILPPILLGRCGGSLLREF